ncbi:MAG TPA: signal peptide peptidase SppA [bacterium]|nr:signal peptide peptidase SppA [bacterium]
MAKKALVIIVSISSVVLLTLFFTILRAYNSDGDTKGTKIVTDKGAIFSKDEVAVLEIKGVIAEADEVLEKIRTISEKSGVKAVIVRIDSPGGGVAASQEIYEELKRLDKTKPVIASLSSLAASGGYYVAIGARKIVANPGSLTGSIGVIMQLADLQKLYDFIKITPITIKSGKFKDIGSTSRNMTTEERQILQKLSDDIHVQFKKHVAEARKIPMSEVDKLADGRIFTGLGAKDVHLVDEIGNFEDAIDLAAKEAGIKGKPKLYYPEAKKDGLLKVLMGTRSFLDKFLTEAQTKMPIAM